MYNKLIRRARIVMEALPYLRNFNGKVFVIKYGGSAMEDPELKQAILQDIVLLKYLGIHPILVHGGGREINRFLKRKKLKPKFVQGLRVTDKETMRVVEHVLGNRVNTEICRLIKRAGGKAKGFFGKKGKVIKARKLLVRGEGGENIDLGFTGTVEGIKYRFLMKWVKKGYVPVLSSIGVGRKGKTYNINADSAAASLAGHLKAAKLILLTDVDGVLDHRKNLISEIGAEKARKLIRANHIRGGMIPKVKCGLAALKKGTEKVHILNANIPHALLLEIFTDKGIGTMVVK